MPAPEVSRQIDERLRELHQRHAGVGDDTVTNYHSPERGYYPPEDAGEERDHFAISLVTVDGESHDVGDHRLSFPLQSISKVFTYGLALADHGRQRVLERVGVEPSGEAFHSIVFDERNNRPYNPMVNAGALVTTDLVEGDDAEHKAARLVDSMRRYAANAELDVDKQTYSHGSQSGDRNRATAYLMRSLGMMEGDVEEALDLYVRQCSVHVTCHDLAVMAATLANGGINPVTDERALPYGRVRDVLSVMYTCGMYDSAGQWAFEVGVPAKSGISGGLLVVIPGKMGIGLFSPGLDSYGNSVRGVRVCEELSDRLGLHVFAAEAEDAMLRIDADGDQR